jgi:hypothetical protein
VKQAIARPARPTGPDVLEDSFCVFSSGLHDGDDENAVRILRRCAGAAAETGQVVVEDFVEDDHGIAAAVAGIELSTNWAGATSAE